MKKLILIVGFIGFTSLFAQENNQVVQKKSYYDTGEIKTDKFEMSNGEVKMIWYYKNGNVRETGFFRNGTKHGLWTQYNENGLKTAQAYYEKGAKEGTWSFWNTDGNLVYQLDFNKNVKLGAKHWDNEGKLIAKQ